MNTLEKKVYSVPEIAAMLGISRTKAYDLTHREDFPAIRLGRRTVVRCEDFERWLEMLVGTKK